MRPVNDSWVRLWLRWIASNIHVIPFEIPVLFQVKNLRRLYSPQEIALSPVALLSSSPAALNVLKSELEILIGRYDAGTMVRAC